MENKVCFLTGSGSGNGRSMALRMAELGYDIALHHSGRDPQSAEEIRSQIAALGRRVEVFVEDLSQSGAAARLFCQFAEKFDRLDIFVNNAGITRFSRIPEMTEEMYDQLMNIDLRAACFCIKEACLFMRERGIKGSVVTIASNHHSRLWLSAAAYGSAKEAMCRYVKYAAMEFCRDGIRVNCIAPGYIDREYGQSDKTKESFARISRTEIPMHRFVTSREIADWTEFISSPAGLSLTGQTIDLDGGASIVGAAMQEYGLILEEE